MLRYIARRLLAGLISVSIVSILVFIIVHTVFDPENFIVLLGDEELSEEQVRAIREEFGLHEPLYVQYLIWIGNWITGNWGESFFSSEAIWENFMEGLPATLQLAAMAQAISALVGVPAGVLMALKMNSWIDILGRAISRMSLTLPIFLTGILLLVVGINFLGWSSESESTRGLLIVEIPGDSQISFLLSALALGLPAAAAIALMTRSSTLDSLHQHYVEAMTAPETSHSVVLFLYTLRYTILPAAVILALTFPAIVGGTLIMEWIFILDGVGYMLVLALNQRDYPTIESLALFYAVWVIAVNTLVDILCGWLDPNVRSTRKSLREEWNHLANPVRLV